MEFVQYVEEVLRYVSEITFLCASLYIVFFKNMKAGIFITVYSIYTLLGFLLLRGVFGSEILAKIFYAGAAVNLYLQTYGIMEAVTKFSLLFGIYLLIFKPTENISVSNDS